MGAVRVDRPAKAPDQRQIQYHRWSTRILSYLYTEFLWFSHGSDLKRPWRRGKARNCHEPVMLRD